MHGGLAIRSRAWSLTVRTDEELITEVLRGETSAFSELAARHQEKVERLCHRFFADREVIRDMAQETFIRAFAKLSTYRTDLPFRAWLRTITINVCYDELRKRQRRPEELLPDLDQAEQTWANLVTEATPETIVQAAQDRIEAETLARRLLASLSPDDRLVMTLKETEELSVAEIAEIMGWSEAKVKIRAFRARQSMRRRAEKFLASSRNLRR
jgi:RNA polymerase sigma-70 factor (ECF subfamily)